MAKKKRAKSLPKLKKELQIVFNKFIRQRDEGKPCISSGKTVTLQAGHFFPVSTHDGLRYDEDNCHGESAYSNCFDQGHLIMYRDNLLARIGQKRFNALYERAANYKKHGYKWSRSELEDKIAHYKKLLK